MSEHERLSPAQQQEIVAILEKYEVMTEAEQLKIAATIEALGAFMTKHKDVNENEELAKELNTLWINSRTAVESALYNFNFTEEEYKFFMEHLKKAEFQIIEDVWSAEDLDAQVLSKKTPPKFPLKAGEVISYPVTLQQNTKIYGILNLYKAKGLYSDTTRIFSSLMRKVSTISLVFSYFNQISRELGYNVHKFSLGLTPKEKDPANGVVAE